MKIRNFIFFYIKKPIKNSILLQTAFKCILLKILKSLAIEVIENSGIPLTFSYAVIGIITFQQLPIFKISPP